MHAVVPVGAAQAGELELQQQGMRQQQGEVDVGQLQDNADGPDTLHKLLKNLQQQQQQHWRASSSHHSSHSDAQQPPEAAAADDTATVCAAASADGPPSSQLQPAVSLGTWDGGGLWLSGSLAPVEPQQGQGTAPAQGVLAAPQVQQALQQQRLQQVQGCESPGNPAVMAGNGAGSSQLQPGVSLGTWDGDGLWPSGSLAPLDVQGEVPLAQMPGDLRQDHHQHQQQLAAQQWQQQQLAGQHDLAQYQ
jgi:hypothetical protein